MYCIIQTSKQISAGRIILLAVFIFWSMHFIFFGMALQPSFCVCQCEMPCKFNEIYRKEIIFIGFKL